MADNNVNWIQIRKIDASGSILNLDLQDAIGSPLGFVEDADNTSEWTIQTLQEYDTYYLLGVVEDNSIYNGTLSNTFNNLEPSITTNQMAAQTITFAGTHDLVTVTGDGSGATL